MFEIYGGKAAFDQWDLNQRVTCSCLKVGDPVIFYAQGKYYTVTAYASDGGVWADVPNFHLQQSGVLRVELGHGLDVHLDCRTYFDIVKKDKPADYVCEYNIKFEDDSNGGSGGGAGVDVTASVGQTIVVEEVDANGKPTKWKAADYQEKICGREWGEIVPLTEVRDFDPQRFGVPMSILPVFVIEDGKTYVVIFDGVQYSCVATQATMSGYRGIALGNPMLSGGVDNGMPFGIAYIADFPYNYIFAMDMNPHSVQVFAEVATKIPAKFIPTLEEMRTTKTVVLPETTYNYDAENDDWGMPFVQINDAEYKVVYNGTEYTTRPIILEDGTARFAALGNTDVLTEIGDNGIPFILVFVQDIEESYAMPTPLDGAETCTLSITEVKATPIPAEYMPKEYMPKKHAEINVSSDDFNSGGGGSWTGKKTLDTTEIMNALANGSQIYINFASTMEVNRFSVVCADVYGLLGKFDSLADLIKAHEMANMLPYVPMSLYFTDPYHDKAYLLHINNDDE